MTGVSSYPHPEKGYMEQDAELMLAFEVLEELYDLREKQEEQRKKMQEEADRYFGKPS